MIVPLFTVVDKVTTGGILSLTTFTDTFTRQPLLAVSVPLYVAGVSNTGFAPPDTGAGLHT